MNNNLMNRITREIEEKAMKYGLMGNESVNIILKLTNEELKEFEELNFDNHYNWEIDGNLLSMSYIEEIK